MALTRMFISGLSTISALGASGRELVEALGSKSPTPSVRDGTSLFSLGDATEVLVDSVRRDSRFEGLDRVTLLALAAASLMRTRLSLDVSESFGVSIGSSRGPTISTEATHSRYLDSLLAEGVGRVPVHTSPSTTAGNTSAWVAQLLMQGVGRGKKEGADGARGFCCNTSMTCTSAFHSLLTGVAFLRAGMAQAWVFGGAEAPLTGYTIAQMKALRIYSRDVSSLWPCRPLINEGNGESTMVLGEGAGVAALRVRSEPVTGEDDLELLGVGWSMEQTPSATGVSEDGAAFESSMQQALSSLNPADRISAVILHAPGSRKGDVAELAAVLRVFKNEYREMDAPALITSKPFTGHTFGASGMLSLELARVLGEGAAWPGVEYSSLLSPRAVLNQTWDNGWSHDGAQKQLQSPQTARFLINTAGFGGNVISIVVARP